MTKITELDHMLLSFARKANAGSAEHKRALEEFANDFPFVAHRVARASAVAAQDAIEPAPQSLTGAPSALGGKDRP